ncbi:UNVERIFIED_CONTAM: hypothetical protein NCL1_60559 [Trichonephila clavipes]
MGLVVIIHYLLHP